MLNPQAELDALRPRTANAQIVARNALWLIVQPLLLNVVSIVVVAAVARHLGPHDYGLLVLFISIGMLLLPFANLGLRQLMVREIAGQRSKAARIAGEMLPLRVCLAGAFLLVAMPPYAHFAAPEGFHALLLIGVAAQVLLLAAMTTLTDTLIGLERMRTIATVQLIKGLLLQSLLALCAFMRLPLEMFACAYVLGNIVAVVFLYGALRSEIGRLPWKLSVQHQLRYLRHSLKFAAPPMLETLRARTAPLILGARLGPGDLGTYGAPVTLLEGLDILKDGVCTALFPRVVRLYAEDPAQARKLARQVAKMLVLLGTAVAVGVYFAGERLIELIFGHEYQQSGPLLVVMATALPAAWTYSVMYNFLNATGAQQQLSVLSGIATPISLACLAAFTLWWGVLGAAFAYALSPMLLALGAVVIYWRRHGPPLDGMDALKTVLVNALMSVVLIAVSHLHVLLMVICGGLAFVAAVLALRMITLREVQSIFSGGK